MRANNKRNPTGRSSNEFDDAEVQTWFEEEEEERAQGEDQSPKASSESIADKYARSQLRVVRETKDYTLDYLKW